MIENAGLAMTGFAIVMNAILVPAIGWLLTSRLKSTDQKIDALLRKSDEMYKLHSQLRIDHERLQVRFEDHIVRAEKR